MLCHKIEQTLASFSQRAFVRFAVRVPIEYSYRRVGAPATLVNVGRLGALLHCRQMLHVGVRETLSIAFRELRFSLTPVVAHLRVDENAARSGDFFIGLDFADIAPTAEAHWLSVLGELVQTSAGDGAQRKIAHSPIDNASATRKLLQPRSGVRSSAAEPAAGFSLAPAAPDRTWSAPSRA